MNLTKKASWEAAIPKLQSAISQKEEEGNNIKFYGMKFGDYFPHYYLGLAYFNTGELAAAVREFEISELQGSIQKEKELYSKLTDMKVVANAQLSAKTMLNQPEVSPPIPAPVVRSEETEKPKHTETEKKETGSPAVSGASTTTPTKEASVESTPSSVPTEPAFDPEALRKTIRSGARKYFEGSYDDAIWILLSAIQVNPNEASAQFLLGCCYASKYLLTGSLDQKLFQKATLAFQKAKQIDPAFSGAQNPYISPAVIELYQKTS